jgi:hypothetical protein
MKANPDKLILFLSVRRIVGDRHSRADFLVAAYFRAGGEVNVLHLVPALDRDLVARDRNDFSSHLGSLRECRATKREACRSDCDEDRFHFHHGIEPRHIAKRKLSCALFVRPFPFVAPQSAVVVAAYDLSRRLLERRSAVTANIQ